MAIVAGTVTINPAFLMEIKEDHRELWQLLADLDALGRRWETAGVSPKRVADLLSQLQDRLAMHFTLEEAYGYFDDALAVAPQLSRRAETLRGEHAGLFLQLSRIVDEAERLVHHEVPIAALGHVIEDFSAFHRALKDHESRENALVSEAFDLDVGVGD